MLTDWQNQYCLNGSITINDPESIQSLSNSSDTVHRSRENNPKIYMKAQKPPNTQYNTEQKRTTLGGITIPNFRLWY